MVTMLEQFFNEKGLADKTKTVYKCAVERYEELQGLTLEELLEEADLEEENGVRWKRRKLKTRLINYRNWLYDNLTEGTAKRYFGSVKTIYKHFEIEVQPLPSFNTKQIDRTYEKTFKDILTVPELQSAYYEASDVGECIILWGISSGISKVDLLKITVEQFISYCEEYFKLKGIKFKREDTLLETLQELLEYDELIPVIEGERQKTGTRFTTFCSPEAVIRTIHYLIGRDVHIRESYEEFITKTSQELGEHFNSAEEINEYIENYIFNHNITENELNKLNKISKKATNLPQRLEYSHKLFKVTDAHLSYSFRRINEKLELGKVGNTTKFRCHQLRAFQASTLLNLEHNAFTESEVDALQGRKKDATHRAYFTESVSKLFKKYYEVVDSLMLFKSIHIIDEEEMEKLVAENNQYKKEIMKNKSQLEEQQHKIDEIMKLQEELEALVRVTSSS